MKFTKTDLTALIRTTIREELNTIRKRAYITESAKKAGAQFLQRKSRKVKRSALVEQYKLYESMWDAAPVDEAEVDACLARVAEATKINGQYPDDTVLYVSLSKEDLKKALKLGGYATYQTPMDKPVPAQLVDSVYLNFAFDDDFSHISLSLGGDREGFEEVNEYFDAVPFVGFIDVPETFRTEKDALNYFKKNIEPKANQLAHEIIETSWAESGYTDYDGITAYESTDSEDDLWQNTLNTADNYLATIAKLSGNARYDDGDGYWQTEYTDWCFRYLYHNGTLNNIDKLEALCHEYSEKLPNVEFYCIADDDIAEIGYTATR